MNLVESVKHCYKNYSNFKGRATRSEFWYFYLFFYLIIFLLTFISGIIKEGEVMFVIGVIFVLGSLIPFAAVTARRLHDVGRSGWWQVLAAIPYVNIIGVIALIVWWCSEGEKKKNKYGPPIKINERKR